ncbi:MAG: cell division protein FtsW [Microbacteriaceae bacterium]|nr:cell division protein FtsW [Microbacteriaceae bacterium]
MVIQQPRPTSNSTNPPHRRTAAEYPADNTEKVESLGFKVFVSQVFNHPGRDFYYLFGITIFMVVFGSVMVLSSSSVESISKFGEPFAYASKHFLIALLAVPMMLIISLLPRVFWFKWARIIAIVAMALQIAVAVGGMSVGTNRNWLNLFGVTIQPSEMIKFSVILLLAVLIARRTPLGPTWQEQLMPAGIAAVGALILVMLGNDLGTAIVIALICLSCYYFAGVRIKYLFTLIAVGGVTALGFVLSSPDRLNRVTSFMADECDILKECWQVSQANFALANGGIFGVGLGNSKAKWLYLPTAENDFIFAVIGEELGLIGAVAVIILYIAMAGVMVRILVKSADQFSRVVVGGVLAWVVFQALLNIAVVLQLFPVLGVPLPFISAGGSALVATLAGVGLVLGVARRQNAQ